MSTIQQILAFLVAILLLVSLHELGHLIIARLCNIKVLRFSVGFGTPFFKKTWRNIEWCLAPIPLGGYVKMVDTREGEVAEADLPYAFDKQHPLKRIAVVAAGPLTNLVLAVLLYCFAFSVGGVTEIQPYVGTVSHPSIASKAGFETGDRILRVNGIAINDFADAQAEIVLNLENGQVTVDVETNNGQTAQRIINASGTEEAAKIAKRQASLGISPMKYLDTIGYVASNSAAERAGLKVGDKIISVDNQPTPTWAVWSKITRENAGRNLPISYQRAGQIYQAILQPTPVELPDKSQIIGRVGLSPALDQSWANYVRQHKNLSISQAWQYGWAKTAHYTTLTFSFFGKLVTGNASFDHISGPITIAAVAGQTVQIGWQPYIEFLALVSISLGVMNLLPIPVLDGGHLVFYVWEWIRGKPLSQYAQEISLRLGAVAMLLMMLLAFFNDISQLLGR